MKNSFINSKEFSKLMDLKGKFDIQNSSRVSPQVKVTFFYLKSETYRFSPLNPSIYWIPYVW